MCADVPRRRTSLAHRTLTPLVLLAVACTGPPAAGPSTVATPVATSEQTTTPTIAPTVTRTGRSTTTTTVPVGWSPIPAGTPLPMLEDGRPATFLAVTTDYEAVEVDTESGAVLRSLGRVSDRKAVESAECAACINAVDAVWRTVDGSLFLISECCEPAAGHIHLLAPAELPLSSRSDSQAIAAWSAAPAPSSGDVAFLGYALQAGDPLDPELLVPDVFSYGEPMSNAVWDRAGRRLSWLVLDGESAGLRTVDLDTGTIDRVTLEFPLDRSGGLATAASGNLVTIRHQRSSDGTITTSVGVVFSPTGALVAEFPVPTGAVLGGYDRTGTYLVVTDPSGTATWMGGGRQGVLGTGFLFAGW